jgi:hypothetical protein
MPLPFACPECGLETLVDDEFAGHSGPCAGCGKVVTVPTPLLGPLAGSATAVRPAPSQTRTVLAIAAASIVAASVVFSALIWLVLPVLASAGRAVQRVSCRGNLERIAAALKQYEIQHGTLPPAFIPDASGKPMHSWRVLILPQLGEEGLYARYQFDEPWDGPNNIQLVNAMPDVFGCPADGDARSKGESSYMVVVGPETLFPGKTTASIGQARDDHALTILVAEVPAAGVVWTQPKDLDATRMKFSINAATSGEIASMHAGGANVVTADGEARFISELFPDEYLNAMSTASGGEDVPLEALE